MGTGVVFKRKVDSAGEVKYKCRFVAQGFRQVPGLDHTEKYAPAPAGASTDASGDRSKLLKAQMFVGRPTVDRSVVWTAASQHHTYTAYQ